MNGEITEPEGVARGIEILPVVHDLRDWLLAHKIKKEIDYGLLTASLATSS